MLNASMRTEIDLNNSEIDLLTSEVMKNPTQLTIVYKSKYKGRCTANTDSIYSLTFRALALLSNEGTMLETLDYTIRIGKEGKGREGKGREGKGREGKGREGKGREGKGREGKGREGKGREGKGRELDKNSKGIPLFSVNDFSELHGKEQRL